MTLKELHRSACIAWSPLTSVRLRRRSISSGTRQHQQQQQAAAAAAAFVASSRNSEEHEQQQHHHQQSQQQLLLALGTMGLNPRLEFAAVDFSDAYCTQLPVVASVAASSPFQCIAWAPPAGGAARGERGAAVATGSISLADEELEARSLGLLAAGMADGDVTLWDAAATLNRCAGEGYEVEEETDSSSRGAFDNDSKGSATVNGKSTAQTNELLVASVPVHRNQRVQCIQFNPLRAALLAAGGGSNSVSILDVENVKNVAVYEPGGDMTESSNEECTALAWNAVVSHVLATSSASGTAVWDLKQRKSALSFCDPAHRQCRPSAVAWLADQPTQLLLAYDDDRHPAIQLWDLRNASYPLKEATASNGFGHTRGVVSLSLNPFDSRMLLSSGRDNRVVCWCLEEGLQPLYSSQAQQHENSNSRFEVYMQQQVPESFVQLQWAPSTPGVFACASPLRICIKALGSLTSFGSTGPSSTGGVGDQSQQQQQHGVGGSGAVFGEGWSKGPAGDEFIPSWFKKPRSLSLGFGDLVSFAGPRSSAVVCAPLLPLLHATAAESATKDVKSNSEVKASSGSEHELEKMEQQQRLRRWHEEAAALHAEVERLDSHILQGDWQRVCEEEANRLQHRLQLELKKAKKERDDEDTSAAAEISHELRMWQLLSRLFAQSRQALLEEFTVSKEVAAQQVEQLLGRPLPSTLIKQKQLQEQSQQQLQQHLQGERNSGSVHYEGSTQQSQAFLSAETGPLARNSYYRQLSSPAAVLPSLTTSPTTESRAETSYGLNDRGPQLQQQYNNMQPHQQRFVGMDAPAPTAAVAGSYYYQQMMSDGRLDSLQRQPEKPALAAVAAGVPGGYVSTTLLGRNQHVDPEKFFSQLGATAVAAKIAPSSASGSAAQLGLEKQQQETQEEAQPQAFEEKDGEVLLMKRVELDCDNTEKTEQLQQQLVQTVEGRRGEKNGDEKKIVSETADRERQISQDSTPLPFAHNNTSKNNSNTKNKKKIQQSLICSQEGELDWDSPAGQVLRCCILSGCIEGAVELLQCCGSPADALLLAGAAAAAAVVVTTPVMITSSQPSSSTSSGSGSPELAGITTDGAEVWRLCARAYIENIQDPFFKLFGYVLLRDFDALVQQAPLLLNTHSNLKAAAATLCSRHSSSNSNSNSSRTGSSDSVAVVVEPQLGSMQQKNTRSSSSSSFWRDALALVCCYAAHGEQLSNLCRTLGDRLQTITRAVNFADAGLDATTAANKERTVVAAATATANREAAAGGLCCYVCAGDFEGACRLWGQQLVAVLQQQKQQNTHHQEEKEGRESLLSSASPTADATAVRAVSSSSSSCWWMGSQLLNTLKRMLVFRAAIQATHPAAAPPFSLEFSQVTVAYASFLAEAALFVPAARVLSIIAAPAAVVGGFEDVHYGEEKAQTIIACKQRIQEIAAALAARLFYSQPQLLQRHGFAAPPPGEALAAVLSVASSSKNSLINQAHQRKQALQAVTTTAAAASRIGGSSYDGGGAQAGAGASAGALSFPVASLQSFSAAPSTPNDNYPSSFDYSSQQQQQRGAVPAVFHHNQQQLHHIPAGCAPVVRPFGVDLNGTISSGGSRSNVAGLTGKSNLERPAAFSLVHTQQQQQVLPVRQATSYLPQQQQLQPPHSLLLPQQEAHQNMPCCPPPPPSSSKYSSVMNSGNNSSNNSNCGNSINSSSHLPSFPSVTSPRAAVPTKTEGAALSDSQRRGGVDGGDQTASGLGTFLSNKNRTNAPPPLPSNSGNCYLYGQQQRVPENMNIGENRSNSCSGLGGGGVSAQQHPPQQQVMLNSSQNMQSILTASTTSTTTAPSAYYMPTNAAPLGIPPFQGHPPPSMIQQPLSSANASSTSPVQLQQQQQFEQVPAFTAPTVGAQPIKPGMPVPWPIPTSAQLNSRPTKSTYAANLTIHRATEQQPNTGAPSGSVGTAPALSPEKQAYVQHVIGTLLQQPAGPAAADLGPKMQEMFSKLASGEISSSAAGRILRLCECVERREFIPAMKVHAELSSTEWGASSRNWLMALKRLLPRP